MEVWQSAWLTSNWVSLARWQERLASGLRIAAIGGSDFHQPDRLLPEGPLALGRPTTVLWLHELSEDAVLAAMKAGRGYVTESPTARISAHVAGTPMGSSVASGPLDAEAESAGAPGDELVWLDATGIVRVSRSPPTTGAATFAGTPSEIHPRRDPRRGQPRRDCSTNSSTARCEQPGLGGSIAAADLETQPILRALSNPIYVDP